MLIISMLFVMPFSYNWYISLPEAMYMTFMAVRFTGPLGILMWFAYSAALAAYPDATTFVVGAIMVVHAAVILFRKSVGDSIARDQKKKGIDNSSTGIPRMAGESKAVQESLDRLKENR